jgi:hypothetical protein
VNGPFCRTNRPAPSTPLPSNACGHMRSPLRPVPGRSP